MERPKRPELTLDLLSKSKDDHVIKELLKIENEYNEKKTELNVTHSEKDGNLHLQRITYGAKDSATQQNNRTKEVAQIHLRDDYRTKAEETFKHHYPDISIHDDVEEKDVDDFLKGHYAGYDFTYIDRDSAKEIFKASKDLEGDYYDGFRSGVLTANGEIIEKELGKAKDNDGKSIIDKSRNNDLDIER